MNLMKVLILAGGYATRLWPLTEKRAKPLLYINGKSILGHLIDKIPKEDQIYILTNKKFEIDFQEEIKKTGRKGIEIFCEDSFSDGQKLGALGAISLFLDEANINENLAVFAGDNILPNLAVSVLDCKENEAHICVRAVESLYEARKFGVVEMEEGSGEVISFEEKPENPKSKTVLTGFLSLGKNMLPILKEYAKKSPDALGGIFMELLKQKKSIIAHRVDGEWFDIGSFESYLEAHKKLQVDQVKCGKNTTQKANKYAGKVYLGDNCVIKNCKITDSIIYDNTVLENCYISNAVIDSDCNLNNLDINQKLIRGGTRIN